MKAKTLPNIVLLLNFDETIAISEKNSKNEYIFQKNGSINAAVMDQEKLQNLVDLAILFHVPIHIVTARADTRADREVIEKVIDGVGGFKFGSGWL